MTIIRQSSFRAREAVAFFSRGSREEPLVASGCGYKVSGWIFNRGARSNRAREAMGTRLHVLGQHGLLPSQVR